MENQEFVRAEARSSTGEFVVAFDRRGGQWALRFDDPRLAGLEIGPYKPDTEGIEALTKKDVAAWALRNGFELEALERFIKETDRSVWLDWKFDDAVKKGSRLARTIADYLGFGGDDTQMFREILSS